MATRYEYWRTVDYWEVQRFRSELVADGTLTVDEAVSAHPRIIVELVTNKTCNR